MLSMHPAQIYVVFQNMIFLEKFVSTTFHYLHGHAKFWEQKFSSKGLQGIPLILTHLA